MLVTESRCDEDGKCLTLIQLWVCLDYQEAISPQTNNRAILTQVHHS